MKKYLNALGITLSMYTRIPMKRIDWTDEYMKYSLCFLPVPGFVLGIAEMIWFIISMALNFTPVYFAAVSCIIILLVTGGIHMDGFIDLSDAHNSYEKEKKIKLQIMKDPHVGGFGVIWFVAYMLMLFASFYELYSTAGGFNNIWILGAEQVVSPGSLAILHLPLALTAIFMTSRGLAVYAIASIPLAKEEGMLYGFVKAADKKTLYIAAAATAVVCEAAMLIMFGIPALIFIPAAALLSFVIRHKAIGEFSGLTGDICGWFIQVSEVVLMAALVFVLKLA